MKTEDFIRALAADNTRPIVPIGRVLLIALAIGALLSASLLLLTLHPRPDLEAALYTPAVVFKLIVALSLAAAASARLSEAARPLSRFRWRYALVLPPALLAGGIITELSIMPAQTWLPRLVGHNALHCLMLIPLLSLAPTSCLLIALRRGAPIRPGFAGAMAGLVSGGVGAVLYALTCPDDSPLFIAAWYSIAVMVVTAISGYIGSRALRW